MPKIRFSMTTPQARACALSAAPKYSPKAAKWNPQLSEFILMYDDVRLADSPEQALLEFLENTYDAGASLAKWDRAALES